MYQYQIGDLIVYGGNGVCKVTAIGTQEVAGGDERRAYYTLQPVYSTETIYAPVDSKVTMRPVLTKPEADQLILRFPSIQEDPVDDKNVQLLSRYYQTSFQAHDCGDLMRLLKTIHAKNTTARKNGKKPGKIEERFMKRAEELLYGELSIALGIPRDGVPEYIKGMLKNGGLPQAENA